MLKAKNVSTFLEQSNTDGVSASMLMTSDGSLLASAGDAKRIAVVGAIAANMWTAQKSVSASAFKNDELRLLIAQCENAVVGVVPVNSLLLCVVAEASIPLGLFRAKAESLRDYMAGALSELDAALTASS
eukprot:ANDGO_02459.mRNA.1 Ragulator complex protein LAMTOR2 homolog